MKTHTVIPLIAIGLGLAACASDSPRLDAALGQSTEWIAAHQTLDPLAGLNPVETPLPADGVRLKNALDVQRKDVSPGSTQVGRSVEFDAGRH
jgi:hypothetical protein